MSIERAARAICSAMADGAPCRLDEFGCIRCHEANNLAHFKRVRDAGKAALQSQWRDFDPEDKDTWPEGDTPFVCVVAQILTAVAEQPLRWDTENNLWVENDYGPFNTKYLNIIGQPRVTRYMPIPDTGER